MLAIRLQRIGRKNEAQFRVVLTDHKNAAKSGKFLKVLGSYNPKLNKISLNGEEIKRRMSEGAKPSATVMQFLKKEGIVSKASQASKSSKASKKIKTK